MVPVKDPSHPAREPDERTLDACRRGDREALDRTFRVHAPRLHRLIARLVVPTADVDDLLQTTIVRAIVAFPRFRGDAALDTWLARIAVNVVRSHAGRERPAARIPLELVGDAAATRDPAPAPDRLVDDRRRLERLHHHLGAIGAAKRIAFLLHVVEGLPVDEVAALTGAGVFATRSRIYWAGRALRARARKDPLLRDLLSDAGGKP